MNYENYNFETITTAEALHYYFKKRLLFRKFDNTIPITKLAQLDIQEFDEEYCLLQLQ